MTKDRNMRRIGGVPGFSSIYEVDVEIDEEGYPFQNDGVCWRCEKHGKVRWFEGAWLCDECLKELMDVLKSNV
jgi:hypothetical protein